jgi:hypothetical protein
VQPPGFFPVDFSEVSERATTFSGRAATTPGESGSAEGDGLVSDEETWDGLEMEGMGESAGGGAVV